LMNRRFKLGACIAVDPVLAFVIGQAAEALPDVLAEGNG
jgi:hypothetical protein